MDLVANQVVVEIVPANVVVIVLLHVPEHVLLDVEDVQHLVLVYAVEDAVVVVPLVVHVHVAVVEEDVEIVIN
jgi:hypothetical protein